MLAAEVVAQQGDGGSRQQTAEGIHHPSTPSHQYPHSEQQCEGSEHSPLLPPPHLPVPALPLLLLHGNMGNGALGPWSPWLRLLNPCTNH